MRMVLTGANRGIGLELARQLLARGDQVDATVRDPERADALRALDPGDGRLRIHRCDTGDGASIAALAASLGDVAIDGLINNAGVWGGPHQRVGDFDADEALRTFEVDALGPLRLTLALLPQLRRGAGKRVLSITSGMGSIGDNTSGGSYGYRMAKAALNMASRGLAVDLRADGIHVAVINPGWVKTDMGGAGAPTAVEDSVRGLLTAFDQLDATTSGHYLSWRGGEYPW
jgi:NAD(P)-dependent dehydrogenase (short-subunit alcohol dehydrogenase family)